MKFQDFGNFFDPLNSAIIDSETRENAEVLMSKYLPFAVTVPGHEIFKHPASGAFRFRAALLQHLSTQKQNLRVK